MYLNKVDACLQQSYITVRTYSPSLDMPLQKLSQGIALVENT